MAVYDRWNHNFSWELMINRKFLNSSPLCIKPKKQIIRTVRVSIPQIANRLHCLQTKLLHPVQTVNFRAKVYCICFCECVVTTPHTKMFSIIWHKRSHNLRMLIIAVSSMFSPKFHGLCFCDHIEFDSCSHMRDECFHWMVATGFSRGKKSTLERHLGRHSTQRTV